MIFHIFSTSILAANKTLRSGRMERIRTTSKRSIGLTQLTTASIVRYVGNYQINITWLHVIHCSPVIGAFFLTRGQTAVLQVLYVGGSIGKDVRSQVFVAGTEFALQRFRVVLG